MANPHLVDLDTPCVIWAGGVNNSGYGHHREVFEHAHGPIPTGLVIDHLCRIRRCINTSHMEPVTQRVNVQRGMVGSKTHCKNGHTYDEINTYVRKEGRRMCRACLRDRARRRRGQLQ